MDKANSSLDNFIDKLEFNIYERNWSQLELKFRKNRVNRYLQTNNIVYKDEIIEELVPFLKKDKYNKYFKYDKKTGNLLEIKCLELDLDNQTAKLSM